uniref:uncharacterized protein LOC120948562 n=1 Tax=Anopheles coluzzii TaxID=1518534 RepID=UPI001AADDFA7|nr:uncharacterized protein LOC120948562 [Anopheles coluzzii]
MALKRPRISVGVMAVCCGVLSLSVVARESASPNEAETGGRKYVAVHHQPVHPGSFSSPAAMEWMPVTTPLTPAPKPIDEERHRKTREALQFSRPALPSDGSITTSPTPSQIRRRRMEPKIRGLPSPLVFMPARGRRFGSFEIPAEKRQITIEQMLEKGDYFVPNRGKKAPTNGELIKKGKFDVLLGGSPDEYFFPNRGKKQYLLAYDAGSNIRPLVSNTARGDTVPLDDKVSNFAVPSLQHLHQPLVNRLRRNLLENLANEHKDTFFSSRGKRIVPMAQELMFLPPKALSDDQQDDAVPEGLTDARAQDFTGQANDLDALFWNEDLLLPLEQAGS